MFVRGLLWVFCGVLIVTPVYAQSADTGANASVAPESGAVPSDSGARAADTVPAGDSRPGDDHPVEASSSDAAPVASVPGDTHGSQVAAGDGATSDLAANSPEAEKAEPALLPTIPVPEAKAPVPAETSGNTGALAEIVVTATKRAETMQNVPAAVSVVDSEQLKNLKITDVAGVTKAVPSFTTMSNPAGAVPQIRGIGSLSFSRTSEQSVGIVLDGVAIANASLGSPSLFDVAQVEILEGPQGTLYGRNSSAGIVNIITNAPDPAGVSLSMHTDLGSRDSAIVNGAFNLPITDDSAVRVAVGYTKAPHNIYNAYQDNWDDIAGYNFRTRYLWDATDRLKLNLIGDFEQQKQQGGSSWAVFQATPGSALSNDLAQCGVTPAPDNSTGCNDGANYSNAYSWGFSGQLDYAMDWATLSSISAYRRFLSDGNGDSDSIQENLLNTNASTNDIQNISEEIRLDSNGDGFWQYVAGLYFFQSDLLDTGEQKGQILQLLPPPLGSINPVMLGQTFRTLAKSRSFAVYEESTLNFTDKFRGIIGLRYGHEEISANTTRAVAPGAVAPFVSTSPVSGSTTDDYISYKFGLQYDLAQKVMSYITYSRGYKGPAINDQAVSSSIPLVVKPEIPLALEVGLKSRFFHNRLQANIAAYDTQFKNFQSQYYDPTITSFVYGNAPKVTIKGVELSLQALLTDQWDATLGLLYNDARYGNGYLVQCAQGQSASDGCQTEVGASGTSQATDAGGNRLIGAPLWKATMGSEFRYEVNRSIEAFMSGDAVYTSRIYFNQADDPINTNSPHVVVGLQAGLRSPLSFWSVSLFVRNLFDERVATFKLANPLGYPYERDPASYVQFFGPESFRTFGISIDGRFE